MLAYVFWHWPFGDVDSNAYEQMQTEFHRSLASSDLAGFHGSWSFQIHGAPWIPPGARGYEDWYLLEDFAALGPLNDNATSGLRQQPHGQVARAAEGGIGGLYRLHSGTPEVPQAGHATWLVKGRETSYEEFYRRLEPLTSRPGTSLWRRQMVLGPTSEFCLLSPAKIDVPTAFQPLLVRRELVAS